MSKIPNMVSNGANALVSYGTYVTSIITLKNRNALNSEKNDLRSQINKLNNLVCRSFNGKTILEKIGDQITHYLFLIVNELKKDVKRGKKQLTNLSPLYEKKDDKQITGFIERSYTKSCHLIKNIATISAHQEDPEKFLAFITDSKLPISYIDSLEEILSYSMHLYHYTKDLQKKVKEKFIRKPGKYLNIHEEVNKMVSDIRDTNQTLNSYINKVSNFKSIYIDNYMKIADDIEDKGFSESHGNKLSDISLDMKNYLTEELFICDAEPVKAIEDKT